MSDSVSVMPEHPPGHRLGSRFRSHRSALDRKSISDLGGIARRMSGGSHQALPRLLHADHLSGGQGDRLRHRAFFLAPRHRARRPAGDYRIGAADHVRSAGAQARQAVAAAAVHARRDEEAGAAGPRDLQRADRRIHRRRKMRRRGALHQAHPGSRHRPHARHSGKGWRPLHQMDPRDPRTRHQGRRHPDARGAGDDRLFRRPYRAAQEASDRRSDLHADERQGQGRPAAVRRSCAGLAAAVADRRHRHHLERDRLFAVASGQDARRPRAAGRGAGTDADSRSRNCCAPIRR